MWCQCYVYVMPSCYVASRCDVSVLCMWCHHVMLHLGVISVLCVCDAIMLCCISVWYQCYVYVMPSCYVASQWDISVMCMWCNHVMLHLGVISVLCVCDAIMLCCISVWCQCYVYVMPSCYVASRCDISVMCMWCHHVMLHLSVLPSCYVASRWIQELLGASFEILKCGI